MKHFIVIRQQHLINTVHAKSVQANTLLVTGIPSKYLSEEALYNLFRDLPGGVKKIWINRYVYPIFLKPHTPLIPPQESQGASGHI
jgi:hypothetical protein